MPATYDAAFALWLTQHGSEHSVAVNVLQFHHDSWPADIFVSDFGEDFAATTEGALAFTALPLGFMVESPTDNVSTEQRLTLRLDNVNGLVVQQFRTLDDEDLLQPVTVTYRVYLDTDRTGPAIDPITMYVTAATFNRLVVELEVTAEYLPNVQAGSRMTIEKFPPLAYL